MKNRKLEPAKNRGELVSEGEILTDRRAMEKMIDGELLKIANEELMPYKAYLLYSAKIFGPMLLIFLTSISGFIFGCIYDGPVISFISSLLMIVSLLISIFTVTVLDQNHGFLVHPLYKLYRARKIFKQVMEELRYETMNGQIELKSLKTKFPEKVKEIIFRKTDEKHKFRRLLDEARNSYV